MEYKKFVNAHGETLTTHCGNCYHFCNRPINTEKTKYENYCLLDSKAKNDTDTCDCFEYFMQNKVLNNIGKQQNN